MSLLTLPKLFSTDFRTPKKKPVGSVEIDWNNPITQGLEALWIVGSQAEIIFDYARGNHLSTTSPGTGTISIVNGDQGISVDGGTTDGYTSPFRAKDGDLSVFYYGRIDFTDANNRLFLAGQSDIEPSSSYDWGGPFISSAGQLGFFPYFGVNVFTTGSVSSGDVISWSGSHAAGVTNGTRMFLNNTLDGVATLSGTRTNTLDFQIGRNWASPVDVADQTFVIYAVWDRPISDTEQRLLHNNPYQILKPVNEPLYLTAGAAPADQTVPVGLSEETDTALSVVPQQDLVIAVGLSLETDTSLDVSPIKDIVINVGLSEETDEALDVQRLALTDINTADEIDSALDILPIKDIIVNVGTSEETDTAFDAVPIKDILVSVGQSSETDTAFNVFAISEIGQGQEVDEALAVTPKLSGPITIQVNIASEADRALALVGQDQAGDKVISNIIFPIISNIILPIIR